MSGTRSVLITGGGGFIGKHLRPLLERKGLNVVSVLWDRLRRAARVAR